MQIKEIMHKNNVYMYSTYNLNAKIIKWEWKIKKNNISVSLSSVLKMSSTVYTISSK
jgi:hypothetical protein